MNISLLKKIRSGICIILLFSSLLLISPAKAQTWPDTSKTYHLLLEAYLFTPAMSGNLDVGQLPQTFICIPASKLLSYLQFGAMLYAEVHNDRFAYTTDFFYASLAHDASLKNGVISGRANVKQFWWEVTGMYKIQPWFELGLGARLNSIENGLNINYNGPGGGSSNKNVTKTNTWVDPLIVTRLKGAINEKWLLQLRADIGGFGIASQFAWQLQPDVYYRVSKLFEVGLGYRAISMNYKTGTEHTDNYFLFDLIEYGPQLHLGFNL